MALILGENIYIYMAYIYIYQGGSGTQGALNPVFLTPFFKAKFYGLGMRCFAALFWKI